VVAVVVIALEAAAITAVVEAGVGVAATAVTTVIGDAVAVAKNTKISFEISVSKKDLDLLLFSGRSILSKNSVFRHRFSIKLHQLIPSRYGQIPVLQTTRHKGLWTDLPAYGRQILR
jgi:hypothetical protein